MKSTFNLTGMADKHDVAEKLSLIHSNDHFMVICSYRDGYVLPDEQNNDRKETLGHVFSAAMEFDDHFGSDQIFWFTDLENDLRLTLAQEIEKRANAMLEVATALRLHHEDELRGVACD